jgi:putative proteasome-type protease
MTYCLAIKVNDGLVFASDSRTNAGVDYVSTYSKMSSFSLPDERLLVLLGSGNLATTQAVVSTIQRDLERTDAETSLFTVRDVGDAAHYIGELSRRVQKQHAEALRADNISAEASFIVGGQIRGRPQEIYLVYPQGNYIRASEETPYLQIGETKYGKPILDRIVAAETSVEDAARCALVSLDSTMRSNISVGPPLELAICLRDSLKIDRRLSLKYGTPYYTMLQKRWNEGLRRAFERLPRFDWELGSPGAKRES